MHTTGVKSAHLNEVLNDPGSFWPFFRSLVAWIVPILLLAALWMLHKEISTIHRSDVLHGLAAIPVSSVFAAILLTAMNYAVMTGYDALAFHYIQNPLPYRRIADASFIAYAFSNTVGMYMLAGSSVRYRLFSARGVTARQVAEVVLFTTVTLWLGLLTLAGTTFVTDSISLRGVLRLPVNTTLPLGILFLICVAFYLILTHLKGNKAVQIFGRNVSLPSLRLAIAQIALSSLDWLLACSVLFVLLPMANRPHFAFFLSRFMLAQVVGLISHVPGGIGVFETTLMMSLPGSTSGNFLGSLVVFRIVYYIFPFLTAVVLLGRREFFQQPQGLKRISEFLKRFLPEVAPRFLAVTTFLAGAVLLISGATPGVITRLQWLDDFLPLPVLEISHFLASLVGVGLLILSRGIHKRLDSAYYMTLVLLFAGIVFSLLKGIDYEEALFLSVMLLTLLPCKRFFYRKASLFADPISASWTAATLLVLGATTWLVFFVNRHLQYTNDLWWQFSLTADAPRSMRAMVAACGLVLVYSAKSILLRLKNHVTVRPSEEEFSLAETLVRNSRQTSAYLSLLGDKALLFNAEKNALLIYSVRKSSWVCLGDPIGRETEAEGLIRTFLEKCDRAGGRPAFYEVEPRRLHLYLDAGLSVLKLGEEARVNLMQFSLEGKERKAMRHIRNRFAKEGFVCEMVPREKVPGVFKELRKISDSWLQQKNTREKGFSLGFFDERYLSYFPVYVARVNDELRAFANVLEGAEREELSVDLMRYLPEGPPDLMEYLFVELMLWAKEQGYRWFNLGMAPLTGLGNLPSRSGWNRFGHFLFRYGEHFYNFQGLREYKEKFDPIWEPRYLAYPGRLYLPRILTDIAALIAGGLRGVITK